MTTDTLTALANTFAFGPGFKYGTKDLDKFFVGFDDSFNRLAKLHDEVAKNIPNYPPYNIKKVEDNKYVVELAVAGFAKTDVEITFEDGKLIVAGKAADDNENENFLYKGIANRAFNRTFVLNDQVEIQNAEMLNGMLKIFLERIIPEHKKPKKIEINEKPAKGKSKDTKPMGELLMEEAHERGL
jgi:molecular chaperone IbpA